MKQAHRKNTGPDLSRKLRVLRKQLDVGAVMLCFFFISGIISILPFNSKAKRGLAIRISSFHAWLILMMLNVRVKVKHAERIHTGSEVRLLVANHVSYLDVFILASLMPAVFITSVELKHTPLLGTIARFAGCLFVERRKAAGLKREIASVAEVLKQGLPVILFPEGTTSSGDHVMQFKNSLFDAAILARADIIPCCLRYTKVNGEPITHHTRDSVYYYGGTTFSEHVPRLLALKSVEMEVLPLKHMKTHATDSRKDLAAQAHEAIREAYFA